MQHLTRLLRRRASSSCLVLDVTVVQKDFAEGHRIAAVLPHGDWKAVRRPEVDSCISPECSKGALLNASALPGSISPRLPPLGESVRKPCRAVEPSRQTIRGETSSYRRVVHSTSSKTTSRGRLDQAPFFWGTMSLLSDASEAILVPVVE